MTSFRKVKSQKEIDDLVSERVRLRNEARARVDAFARGQQLQSKKIEESLAPITKLLGPSQEEINTAKSKGQSKPKTTYELLSGLPRFISLVESELNSQSVDPNTINRILNDIRTNSNNIIGGISRLDDNIRTLGATNTELYNLMSLLSSKGNIRKDMQTHLVDKKEELSSEIKLLNSRYEEVESMETRLDGMIKNNPDSPYVDEWRNELQVLDVSKSKLWDSLDSTRKEIKHVNRLINEPNTFISVKTSKKKNKRKSKKKPLKKSPFIITASSEESDEEFIEASTKKLLEEYSEIQTDLDSLGNNLMNLGNYIRQNPPPSNRSEAIVSYDDINRKINDLAERSEQIKSIVGKQKIQGLGLEIDGTRLHDAPRFVPHQNLIYDGGQINTPKLRKHAPYKIVDDILGLLHIDANKLINHRLLDVQHVGTGKILYRNRAVDDDLIRLLTRRFDSTIPYTEKSIKMFEKIVSGSGLPIKRTNKKIQLIYGTPKTRKNPLGGKGAGSVYSKRKQIKVPSGTPIMMNPQELLERYELIRASIGSGNTSVEMRNEMGSIIDKLKELKMLTPKDHRKLYNDFGLMQ